MTTRSGLSTGRVKPAESTDPDRTPGVARPPVAPDALADLTDIESVLEHQADHIAELERALETARAAADASVAAELSARVRRQASRIAELENERGRARAAADGARAFALREATRRVEIQTELHAVHRTRLWRYSSAPRRVYRLLRLRRRGGRGSPSSS